MQCTAGDAATHLNISGATLSRAFGEGRIPQEFRERAELLGLSIRSLVAACPSSLMGQALTYAETPSADGRKPTRDQVSTYITQLKKGVLPKARIRRPACSSSGRAGGVISVSVSETDSAATVSKDLRALEAKLSKLADVPPDGWPYLFQ